MSRLLIIAFILLATSQGVPAQSQSQELILPIVQNGYVKQPLHYQTTIRIVNLTNSPVEVTLEAYQNDGSPIRILELFPIPRSGTKTIFKIDPFGSTEAFTAGDVPVLNGWARLTYDAQATIVASAEVALINAPVGPHPICQRPSTDIVSSAVIAAVQPASKFSGFAIVRPNRKGSYAILNPSTSQTATVYLSLLDLAGKFVASQTLQIPPQTRVSQLLPEFFPAWPSDFMGSMRITSNIPVGAGGMNILLPEGKFTNLVVNSPPNRPCISIVVCARNPLTGECRGFGVCEIPEGWVPASCCH